MKQPHPLQRVILSSLLFSDGLKYSQLKPQDEALENSQFVFHLKKIMDEGWVEKVNENYILTEQGKEYANRIIKGSGDLETQTKVTTELIVRNDKGEYLVYKRLKQPFFNHFGFPTEKVKLGEDISDAAQRGLKEETGLTGIPKLFAVRHYKVYSVKGDLLEDKLMHGFLFTEVTGDLIDSDEGEYFWQSKDSFFKDQQRYLLEFWDFLEASEKFKGQITFFERKVGTSEF